MRIDQLWVYLLNIGDKEYHVDKSNNDHNNHFLYFHDSLFSSNAPKDWTPPTTGSRSSFSSWRTQAIAAQNRSLREYAPEYMSLSSDLGNPWLFDELPFFRPFKSLFMIDPVEQRGIHCKFGMKGIIAEAHYDCSRNSVAMIGGLRRWMLMRPDQCENLHVYPPSHPSGRHSQVDFSKPNVERFPRFKRAVGNEVILQPGDVLYVPTNWIHYIISLNVNIQCNTRSGASHEYDEVIKACV